MKTRKENTSEKANSPAYGIISFTSKSEARAYLETSFKKGTTEDAFEIVERIKDYAKHGAPRWLYLLGLCYYVGYGNDEDPHKALKCWSKAAGKGEHCSQYALGSGYYYGTAMRKNYKKACFWLEKAAHQDNCGAQALFADCYHFGQGVAKNQKTAVYWYGKAAEQGHANAQFMLGLFYYYGENEVRKNYKRAFQYFTMASDTGHVGAIYQLQKCYAEGKGTKKDSHKALELFRIMLNNQKDNQEEHTSVSDSDNKTVHSPSVNDEDRISMFFDMLDNSMDIVKMIEKKEKKKRDSSRAGVEEIIVDLIWKRLRD